MGVSLLANLKNCVESHVGLENLTNYTRERKDIYILVNPLNYVLLHHVA